MAQGFRTSRTTAFAKDWGSISSACVGGWGQAHKAPLLSEELQATQGCWERKNQSSPGTSHCWDIQSQTVSPEHMYA